MIITRGLQKFAPRALCFVSLCQTAWAKDEAPQSPAPEAPPVCTPSTESVADIPRSDVYKGLPFQAGEESRYILKYGAIRVHVGYGTLKVQPPTKYSVALVQKDGKVAEESRWHRVFSAEAFTGDWYKLIFAAQDKLQSVSRPWDFGVTKFYISQDEEKPFVRKFKAEKWLDFNHATCNVHERTVDHKKNKESNGDHFLQAGAVDALGAFYRLRTFKFELNKTERFLVYTSEKNWWLEATPVEIESIKTPFGTHKAFKLAVKSYLGKELQQRGKLFIWIASEHPNRPMLRVEGEVTFGSIYLEIDRYTPGTTL